MSSSAEMLVRRFCPWDYTLKQRILPNSLPGKNSFFAGRDNFIEKILAIVEKRIPHFLQPIKMLVCLKFFACIFNKNFVKVGYQSRIQVRFQGQGIYRSAIDLS